MPALSPDGTVYVVSKPTNFPSKLLAITSKGVLLWSVIIGDSFSSPAVGTDGTIYVGSDDNHLYAISSAGEVQWKYKTGDQVRATPEISSDGTIFMGSLDSYLYAIRPTGTLKWKHETGKPLHISPAIGLDGMIYFGCADSNLYALDPDGHFKWKYQMDSWAYYQPAVGADGRIYVPSRSFLYVLSPDGGLIWRLYPGGRVAVSRDIVIVASDSLQAYTATDGNIVGPVTGGSAIIKRSSY